MPQAQGQCKAKAHAFIGRAEEDKQTKKYVFSNWIWRNAAHHWRNNSAAFAQSSHSGNQHAILG
jgi:hypothetical protein